MPRLEPRVSRLEQSTYIDAEQMVVLIEFVTPNTPKQKLTVVSVLGGETVGRNEGEDECELIERASRLAESHNL